MDSVTLSQAAELFVEATKRGDYAYSKDVLLAYAYSKEVPLGANKSHRPH